MLGSVSRYADGAPVGGCNRLRLLGVLRAILSSKQKWLDGVHITQSSSDAALVFFVVARSRLTDCK